MAYCVSYTTLIPLGEELITMIGLTGRERQLPDQPWNASYATTEIRQLGRSPKLNLVYSGHAKDQIALRDLLLGDVLFLIKNGFVYEPAQDATQVGFFKYRMECETPNSNGRAVRAVLIPDPKLVYVKVVTVMWVDE